VPNQLNLAEQLLQNGEVLRALDLLQAICREQPDSLQAWKRLAQAYWQQGDPAKAEECSLQALQLAPDDTEALCNLGLVLMQTGRLPEARDHLLDAIAAHPDDAGLHLQLANLYNASNSDIQAENHYRQALKLHPGLPVALNNLGLVYFNRGEAGRACEYYRQAINNAPNYVDAATNLGMALLEAGQYELARQQIDAVLATNPGHACTHETLARLLLMDGQWRRGWQEYEWRLRNSVGATPYPDTPRWDGSSPAARRILIHAEQGVGDEIMFASCLPDLIRVAGQVWIQCDPRLGPLFMRSFPAAQVFPHLRRERTWYQDAGPVDLQLTTGSLPGMFRSVREDFPGSAYLVADPQLVARWRKCLDKNGSTKLNVGISWRGGKVPAVRSVRTITLADWLPLLQNSRTRFINLQYGDTRAELAAVPADISHFDEIDPLREMDNFAALIAALDLVITVDNSTAHLAGALGTPVWVLLPIVADWRWQRSGDDSCWYHSARLFRKQQAGGWSEVLADIVRQLELYGSGLQAPG